MFNSALIILYNHARMCARVAGCVTWYTVLGGTVYNVLKCSVACVYCGMAGCVVWLSEWWLCEYNCVS